MAISRIFCHKSRLKVNSQARVHIHFIFTVVRAPTKGMMCIITRLINSIEPHFSGLKRPEISKSGIRSIRRLRLWCRGNITKPQNHTPTNNLTHKNTHTRTYTHTHTHTQMLTRTHTQTHTHTHAHTHHIFTTLSSLSNHCYCFAGQI